MRIEPSWTYPQVRRAALALARDVERRAPSIATSKWWKEERHGVFLDYNQNAKDRTVASAYSVRPTPDARVSAPLTWDEVPVAELGDFTLLSVPARYASIGDPGAAIDDAVGSLDALLELSARHEKEGLGDAPWPPNYAKQAGEPPRVQPSRKRRADTDYEGRGVDGGPPPEVAAERAAAVASGDPNAGLPTEWPGASRREGRPWTALARPRPADARAPCRSSRSRAPRPRPTPLPAWNAGRRAIRRSSPLLEPADVLVDGMRGRSSLWYRVRVNLIHVPEADRPGQEALDPDYDPMTEWTPADRPDADVTEPETKAESKGAPKPKVAPKPKNVAQAQAEGQLQAPILNGRLQASAIIGHRGRTPQVGSMSIDTLELGRDAIRRHAWTEATEAFAAAGRIDDLVAEDLELLGEAAWWGGHPDDAVDALERAFAAYLATERPVQAAGVAFRLTYLAFRRLAGSIGAGWLARGERLLENEPESAMHAWLQVLYAVMAMMQSRLSDAIGHADRAMELARDHGNPDAHALALSFKGMAEIARGHWQDGLVLIDEAAAAAASGQLGSGMPATSTATRSPPAGTWATIAARGNGPTRPSAGCCASPPAAIRASAGFIAPS